VKRWIAVIALLFCAVASAQSHLPVRDVKIVWDRGAPKVSFSAQDLADERVRRELSSGLRKRLMISVSSHFKGSKSQLASRRFGCDVTRDLWEDGYLVRIGTQTHRFKTLDAVLDHCLSVKGLFVGESKSYEGRDGRSIYFYVRAEFNPISKKQCRELIRPTSGNDPVGPITVNIVRRQICRAERTVEFRSELVEVPR
jgi:hypothetical protein